MNDTFLTPARVEECGLRPDSLPVLNHAREIGMIHISDIRRFTLPNLVGNPEGLRVAMLQLVRTLGEFNIKIEYNGALKKINHSNHKVARAPSDLSVYPRKIRTPRGSYKIRQSGEGDVSAAEGPNREELSSLKRFMQDIGEFDVPTYEESLEFFKKIRAGDEQAKEEYVASNLRLVVSIASRYSGGNQDMLLELTQEGSIGLMKAVEKFEPERGFTFSTYAFWWIRQAITRARAEKYRTIRRPVHITELIRKLRKAERYLEAEFGRPATIEELADELDLSESKIEHLRRSSQGIQSLDAEREFHGGKAGSDGSWSYYDEIHDRNAISPATIVEAKDELEHLCAQIHAMVARKKKFASYAERDTRITFVRAGLDGNHEIRTLQSVGEMFGMTRERVRQIEAKWIRTLDNLGYQIGGLNGWLRLVRRIYELEEMLGIDVSALFKTESEPCAQ